MRAFIDILNEAFETRGMGSRDEVEAILTDNFYRPAGATGSAEIWVHADEPEAEQIVLHISGADVMGLDFTYPDAPEKDRTLHSIEELRQYLSDIDPGVSEFGKLKGMAMLAGIAADLKKKQAQKGRKP